MALWGTCFSGEHDGDGLRLGLDGFGGFFPNLSDFMILWFSLPTLYQLTERQAQIQGAR